MANNKNRGLAVLPEDQGGELAYWNSPDSSMLNSHGHAFQPLPLPNVNDSIGQVNVTGSVVSHVGSRVQADVVNIFPKATTSRTSTHHRRKVIYLSVVLVLALAVIVVISVTLLLPTLTAAKDDVSCGTDKATDVQPSTTVLPPANVTADDIEIVSSETWGGLNAGGQIYVEFGTVSIDNLPGRRCYTTKDCKQILLENQKSTALNYNFLIGDDGKAYEARGWNSLSDYSDPYSSTVVKMGFIGTYDEYPSRIQNQTLYFVINQGIQDVNLKSRFNLTPQCCRGLSNDFGPDEKIREFYAKSFSSSCYLDSFNCRKKRSSRPKIVSSTTKTTYAFQKSQ